MFLKKFHFLLIEYWDYSDALRAFIEKNPRDVSDLYADFGLQTMESKWVYNIESTETYKKSSRKDIWFVTIFFFFPIFLF